MSDELLPCPFCGCAMRVVSNRDWHRIRGDHDEGCPMDDLDPPICAAETDELASLIADWNRRDAAPEPQAEPATSGEVESFNRQHVVHAKDALWNACNEDEYRAVKALLDAYDAQAQRIAELQGEVERLRSGIANVADDEQEASERSKRWKERAEQAEAQLAAVGKGMFPGGRG